MEHPSPDEDITPIKPVRYVLAHIEYKLTVLHRQCERMNLSENAEAALRADLEAEKGLVSQLPPDSPYLESLTLQAAHEQAANARNDILTGERDLGALVAKEWADAWLHEHTKNQT